MRFTATKGQDRVTVEITDEGVIKIETNAVSQANHANCESVFAMVATMAGGSTRRVLKPGINLQQHLHAHMGDGHTHGPDTHTH